MENVLFKFLKPQGAVYAKRMAFYRTLQHKTVEEIEELLKLHLTTEKILQLAARYVFIELNQSEQPEKIKITKEQLEQFFDVH